MEDHSNIIDYNRRQMFRKGASPSLSATRTTMSDTVHMQETALKAFNISSDSTKHINWSNVSPSSLLQSKKSVSGASYCNYTGIECLDGVDVATLVLQDYGLSGAIPSEFGHLTALRRLGLGENNLDGTLPSNLLNDWPDLLHLELFRNNFQGPLPTIAGESLSPYPPLKRMLLQHNDFSGTIPTDYCRFSNLHVLDLSGNPRISGTLPECLGDIDTLYAVHLKGTSMTGTIPEGLCRKQPSEFGCSYVACPVGTYEPNGGHQTAAGACQPCPSSRFLGSKECPPTEVPTLFPTMSPSTAPTVKPSWTPSFLPILSELPTTTRGIPTGFETAPSTANVNSTLMDTSPSPKPSIQTSSTSAPSEIGPYSSSNTTAFQDQTDQEVDWRLLYTAVLLYVVAMISVAMVRRMARGYFHGKRGNRILDHGADTTVSGDGEHMEVDIENDLPPFHQLQAPQPKDLDKDIDEWEGSIESESGWCDSDSSPASIFWQQDPFLSSGSYLWEETEAQDEWTITFSSVDWEADIVDSDVATSPCSCSTSSTVSA